MFDNTQGIMKTLVIAVTLGTLVTFGGAQSERPPWSGKHWTTGGVIRVWVDPLQAPPGGDAEASTDDVDVACWTSDLLSAGGRSGCVANRRRVPEVDAGAGRIGCLRRPR